MVQPPAPVLAISVIVPAYNEQDSIEELYREITDVLTGSSFEIVFVDDGSTDETRARIEALQARSNDVKLIHFPRNRGKATAYAAAFALASGQVVVTLDADLQDDPHEIPAMMAELEAGADLVVGWKQGRFDNEPLKAIPSKVFNGLIGLAFGLQLHDSNCGFRVMRRHVAQSIELYGDLYRFIPELVFVQGYRVVERGVQHRKRKFGRTKYGPRRFWTGLLDLVTVRFITRYAERPLHFFGTVGLVPLTLGVGLEVYVLAMKLLGSTFRVHLGAMIVGVLLIVTGMQCLVTGLVGEMLTAQRHRREIG
jgi:glycosyltransferase involved in cell wall biosynthesis